MKKGQSALFYMMLSFFVLLSKPSADEAIAPHQKTPAPRAKPSSFFVMNQQANPIAIDKDANILNLIGSPISKGYAFSNKR